MLHYEPVLTRAEHLNAASISEADVQVLLDAIALVATPVRISYLWRPMLSDPDDDLVLETVVNGQAATLITFNRRHFEPAAARVTKLAAGERSLVEAAGVVPIWASRRRSTDALRSPHILT